MKNRFSLIIGAVTALFLAFTLGIFLGRAGGSGDVYISEAVTDTAAVPSDVPSAEDSAAALLTTPPTDPVTFPIDINTATVQMLEQLPGIGPTLAQRIVDHRDANGPFLSTGDLTQVEGIGQKKLEDILDLITVQKEDTP